MRKKINKIEPEMAYPAELAHRVLKDLKESLYRPLRAHQLSYIMSEVIRVVNELVDAVNEMNDDYDLSDHHVELKPKK